MTTFIGQTFRKNNSLSSPTKGYIVKRTHGFKEKSSFYFGLYQSHFSLKIYRTFRVQNQDFPGFSQ